MARTLLGQYFGDGVTTTYDVPSAVPAGYILVVEVNGEPVTFDYSDSDTVVLNAAPVAGAIINFKADNDIYLKGAATSGGKVAAYPKTTDGVQTILSPVDYDRVILVSVEVTEVFADGDGAQPTFTLGQTGAATKFSAAAMLDDAAVTAKFVLGGTLTADTALIVTATTGTGTTETGAIEVTVVAVPAIPA